MSRGEGKGDAGADFSRLLLDEIQARKEVDVPKEIEVGDWISWPGVLGQDQGKVTSVDYETYGVQIIKSGGSSTYTTVQKGEGVEKIPPPTE